MKKIILLILSVIALNATSQQVPLQVSGSGWRYVGWYLNGNFPYMEDVYTFTFNGDTSIGSKPYFKYYYSLIHYDNYGNSDTLAKNSYNGCLRSEGEKVYYIAKDSLSELLLYDYSLTVGDTIPTGLYQSSFFSTITDTSTVQMEDGSLRKKFILSTYNPHFIIYGMGYNAGFLPPSTFIVNTYNGGTDLMTYCENGTRVYHTQSGGFGPADNCDFTLFTGNLCKSTSLAIYPNPTKSGIFQIDFNKNEDKVKSLTLLNVLGENVKDFSLPTDNKNIYSVFGINQGYYILRVKFSDGSMKCEKLIIY